MLPGDVLASVVVVDVLGTTTRFLWFQQGSIGNTTLNPQWQIELFGLLSFLARLASSGSFSSINKVTGVNCESFRWWVEKEIGSVSAAELLAI